MESRALVASSRISIFGSFSTTRAIDSRSISENVRWGQQKRMKDGKFLPIRKGTVICQVCPPKPGTDGKDVTGTVLSCPPVTSAHVYPGKNVAADENGQTLTAAVDGFLYIEDNQFSSMD